MPFYNNIEMFAFHFHFFMNALSKDYAMCVWCHNRVNKEANTNLPVFYLVQCYRDLQKYKVMPLFLLDFHFENFVFNKKC